LNYITELCCGIHKTPPLFPTKALPNDAPDVFMPSPQDLWHYVNDSEPRRIDNLVVRGCEQREIQSRFSRLKRAVRAPAQREAERVGRLMAERDRCAALARRRHAQRIRELGEQERERLRSEELRLREQADRDRLHIAAMRRQIEERIRLATTGRRSKLDQDKRAAPALKEKKTEHRAMEALAPKEKGVIVSKPSQVETGRKTDECGRTQRQRKPAPHGDDARPNERLLRQVEERLRKEESEANTRHEARRVGRRRDQEYGMTETCREEEGGTRTAVEREELRQILRRNEPVEATIATVATRFNLDVEDLRRRLEQRAATTARPGSTRKEGGASRALSPLEIDVGDGGLIGDGLPSGTE
jgi:hypothetical protein